MHTRCASPETPLLGQFVRSITSFYFLTVPFVVDEPLTGIELASRLAIYQELNFVRLSCLY